MSNFYAVAIYIFIKIIFYVATLYTEDVSDSKPVHQV